MNSKYQLKSKKNLKKLNLNKKSKKDTKKGKKVIKQKGGFNQYYTFFKKLPEIYELVEMPEEFKNSCSGMVNFNPVGVSCKNSDKKRFLRINNLYTIENNTFKSINNNSQIKGKIGDYNDSGLIYKYIY